MICIEDLHIELGDFSLHGIDLMVDEGEYFVILGPTGSGKTVLLESIAGLFPIRKGRIWLRGQDMTGIEPEKRRVSIVYQDYVLFPHLSVRDNILFGLKLRGEKSAAQQAALDEITGLLRITHLLDRNPETMSGGEKQKVAIARALAVKPDVLLLDEPLSALDPETRETLQDELKRLHKTLGATFVHVTHNFDEATALATRLAIIGEGAIKQTGVPREVFSKPNSEFVARFTMARNIFSGEASHQDKGTVFRTDNLTIAVPDYPAGPCHAVIRPEDIAVSREPATADNCLEAIINGITDNGATLFMRLDAGLEITAMITGRRFRDMALAEGQKVYLHFPAQSVHLFN